MAKTIRTYFHPRRQDVSQGQMLVELYDGALQYLRQARDQMVAQRYSARNMLLNCAIDIIEELAKSLDTRSGGDLAVKLNNLYLLCSSRLLRANQRMCLDDLDAVVAILKRLRAAYALFPGLEQKSQGSRVASE
ncbi:MAG: flagellar export chaperone FliS [Desulfovibrionaceae bacterium]|nr:flagellar export chaperone FliS [Desulfovibrionaceae bacterium]